MKSTLVLIVFVTCNLYLVDGQTGDDLKKLITDLFETKNYNTEVRPSRNQSWYSPIETDVSFFLAGISQLDEISEKLTTTGYLVISWTDQYLSWNSSMYGGIDYVVYPQSKIWKPDMSLQNGFTKMTELGSRFVNVKILNSGLVTWQPFEIFESHCPVDITYFPFDVQTCQLVFVCWSYNSHEVNLRPASNKIQYYEDFSSNGEWTVIGSFVSAEMKDLEVKVTFSLKMKRQPKMFLLNVLTPIILLTVLNLFTFGIPCDSGERISYAISVWLSFAVFLSVINSNLPQSSKSVSVMAIYVILQLIINTIVVIISAIEIRIDGFTNNRKIPKIMHKILKIIYKKSTRKVYTCTKDNQETRFEDEKAYNWKDLVSALDFLLFWVFLVTVLSVSIICFCYVAS